ncbi:NEDD8-activating enzyme E1 regulatory subunit-like [Lytechinus pictus]|uniref:NEDD8-activating enzyme E1 regulatory subunit-like n=1 Tax=Lytechinus pictus TaxID=7653 RepID=UPI0030B9FFA6
MASSRGSPVIDKAKKYDRQLRLWGDHGQEALESAHVCLINATATGTETLKNLILPGIGSFTIVDGGKVKGDDVGNNFFFTKDSIGQSRAQVASELLQELNSDVRGDFVEESVEQLLESNPSFFDNFNAVIATALPERTLLDLAAVLWSNDIPLLVCRCYGFLGYMRLAIKEHTGNYLGSKLRFELCLLLFKQHHTHQPVRFHQTKYNIFHFKIGREKILSKIRFCNYKQSTFSLCLPKNRFFFFVPGRFFILKL